MCIRDRLCLAPLPEKEKRSAWIGQYWGKEAFLFIGASGIAVRLIAPWVKDKFTDSPVLVMDERAEYVIPLLSGHVGGAVEIAREIAGSVGAKPVITTATDVEQVFAVDVFAADNLSLIHIYCEYLTITLQMKPGDRSVRKVVV